jgi:hypothetical protein
LPKVITVRVSHWNRVDARGLLLAYVLNWMAIAISQRL